MLALSASGRGRGRRADDPRGRARLRDQDDRHDELLDAIQTVAAGEACFSPRLAAFVLQAFSAPAPAQTDELQALTPREREVLHHLARGYSYKRIAQRLGISDRTVESHVGTVLRKLQLTSRHEVSHWAATRGLVTGD